MILEFINLAYISHKSAMSDTRKYNFTNRIISIWNSLPDDIVSVHTVDTFKACLDRFWQKQEVFL